LDVPSRATAGIVFARPSSRANNRALVRPNVSDVRLAVVFYGTYSTYSTYSTYGTDHQMAEIAAEAARGEGAEVRLLKVRETAPDEVR
jgi:hypothetical protein